jgi:hypothetical protein
MRPCERSGDCSDPAYQGGMPSGHMAATLYGFTSLYVATPSLVTASLLLASGAIMGESRFRRRFHTMPQIVLGAATGILSVLAIEISRSNQRGKIPTKHVIAASVTPYTTEHVLGAPPLFAVSSVKRIEIS